MNKRRIIWIELLRIFACIGVIGIHVASQHFHDMPVNTSVWAVSNFYHGINRYAVACFVMINGHGILRNCGHTVFFRLLLHIYSGRCFMRFTEV